ncbi:hypothetical protein GQX73_g9122 [Xylaria multiplex]|uniref:UBC core domain-containing protein n=1 Tax=Xylaria multiplex TaxID=323545 RepID=A0A7C8IIF3_9PEZI|nr:hypothetical protein GQX73_g9122 [Xylaria multiplex]
MTTPKFNTKSPTIKRILREAAELSNSPSPDYTASPLESDLFEWHFTLRGPPKSAFAEGIYHGRIVLPPTYPLSPPSFRFTTPSGRFEPNREICLSISGHHEETWQPAWGVRTALVALRTFMETGASGQIGGLDTSDAVRTRLAASSRSWCCGVCARTNEDIIAECEERCRESGESSAAKEVEVPAELRMVFRDEMDKDKAVTDEGAKEDAESAELAEGFVQTTPERTQHAPITTVPSARVAQGVPVPTPTTRIPLPDPIGPVGTATHQQIHIDPNGGVPPWLDYAIMALVMMLVAIILKIMLRMPGLPLRLPRLVDENAYYRFEKRWPRKRGGYEIEKQCSKCQFYYDSFDPSADKCRVCLGEGSKPPSNKKPSAPNTKVPVPPLTQRTEPLEAAVPAPLSLSNGISQLDWFAHAPGSGSLQYQTSGQDRGASCVPDGIPIHLEYTSNANLARCFSVPSSPSGSVHNNLIDPIHSIIADPVNNYNYFQQYTLGGCDFINPSQLLGGAPNPLGGYTPGQPQGTGYCTPRSTYHEGIGPSSQGPREGSDMSSARTTIPRLRQLLPRATSPKETPSTVTAEHKGVNVSGNDKGESHEKGTSQNPESADRNGSPEAGDRRPGKSDRSHTKRSTVFK